MTAAKTPSQRGRSNRNKGNVAERDVAKYLRTVGFPHCERAVRTGFRTLDRTSADPGDLTGCPGLVFSVKDAQVQRLDVWFAELAAMTAGVPHGALGLLVHKRPRTLPAQWWCWLDLATLLRVVRGDTAGQAIVWNGWTEHGTRRVRMELGDVVPLVLAAGYGSPIEVAS